MTLSDVRGDRPLARPDAIALLRRAVDLGITFFDTADVYGPRKLFTIFENEEIVGEALREHRDRVVLATKFGLNYGADHKTRPANARPDHARTSCEGSLHRLRIDCIDLFYLHRVDPLVPVEETVGAMADLVVEGKVRHLGISNASADEIARAHQTHPLVAAQFQWSIANADVAATVISTCRNLGIGVVPWGPLGLGALGSPASGGIARDLAAALSDVAGELGASPAQVALAWLLAQGDDVVPIPGTKRSEHLEENVAAAQLSLPASAVARLSSTSGRASLPPPKSPDNEGLYK